MVQVIPVDIIVVERLLLEHILVVVTTAGVLLLVAKWDQTMVSIRRRVVGNLVWEVALQPLEVMTVEVTLVALPVAGVILVEVMAEVLEEVIVAVIRVAVPAGALVEAPEGVLAGALAVIQVAAHQVAAARLERRRLIPLPEVLSGKWEVHGNCRP